MGFLSNLQGWYQMATQQPQQARQVLGQTFANIGSRITPQVFASGPVTGLSNTIAGTNVTGRYDQPYIQPKPASMITGGGGQTLGAQTSGGGGIQQPSPQPTPQPQSPNWSGMQSGAQDQSQIELQQTLNEYDRAAEEMQAQSGQLDTQRAGALSTLTAEQTKAERQATTSKEESATATQQAKGKALSTAQDVQKKNRNVLRALGILSSSASGEILARPMTEYGTQAAELEQGHVKRLGVIEDWLKGRMDEFTKAKTDVEQQYMTLKENISRDLRFNDRQRLVAVKAAQAALAARTQDIQNQMISYQNTAKQYSDNILLQIAQLKMYNNPTADTSAILNHLLSQVQPNYKPQQVGITQSEEQRKKQLGTLSGY